jgi:hypothetical protein
MMICIYLKLVSRKRELIILLLMLLCMSCQQSDTSLTEIPLLEFPTQDLAQLAIIQEWENSPHANTYGLGKGPNTYCAKCHSPLNWDPQAKIDPPPNCVSCKFPNESELRIAQNNPFVREEDWENIGCEICHRVLNGDVEAEINWLDISTNYYETVETSVELCEKCHLTNDTLKHQREFKGSVHETFTCTDCHNPHSTTANCTAGGCHLDFSDKEAVHIEEHLDQINEDDCEECHKGVADIHMNFLEETPTACMDCHSSLMGQRGEIYQLAHSKIHENLWCVACHDSSNLEVGPLENESEWVVFRLYEVLGQSINEPYKSHQVQLEVNCKRCHFIDNPWGLIVYDELADSDPPMPEPTETPFE